MNYEIRIDPEHFEYLRVQKGRLDSLSHDRAAWTSAYLADLCDTYLGIRDSLPKTCDRFIDIGSGLGGMDILVRRHFQELGQDPEVHLLDGLEDAPRVTVHRSPFNHMRYARNFHVKNGCDPFKFFAHGPETTGFARPFDLILSFGAWCFHFPPSWYLPALKAGGLHPGTIAILEVRNDKPDWFLDLCQVFELVDTLDRRAKWARYVFRTRSL